MNPNDTLTITVYTPESQMRSPVKLAKAMWKDLKDSRELAWRLFVRDFSARYRQSVLGVLWAFLPALLSGAVFIVLQSNNVLNLGTIGMPYPLFVMIGTLLWQLFTDSINAPLKSVQAAKPMLAKINFPREALLLSAVYDVLFGLGIKALVLAAVMSYYRVVPGWGAIWAVPVILMLIVLGVTLGLLITPIGMLYTDVSAALIVATQFWFFVTPVVYPLPTKFPFSLIGQLNPVSPLLVGARDLLTKGTIDSLGLICVVSGLTITFLLLSWVLYRLALPIIVERMSS